VCSPAPAHEIDADLYVIGPEAPLVDGLADRLRARGSLVFGPGADGARLEGSKAWMKDLLSMAEVPTAAYATFASGEGRAAADWLGARPGPWVVKADGLAAGKGVLVTADLDEAVADVESKLSGEAFGAAGRRVVLEEALAGPELSVMAVCDGRRAVPLAAAQDFKRAGDGDAGANTGGMGAYSPVPFAGAAAVDAVMERAVEPTLAALARRGIDYRGVLYAGLMLTDDGPRVLEFNVRFGDPEMQVVAPRWHGDIAAVLAAAAEGDVRSGGGVSFSAESSVCVVLAAEGYPQSPRTGDVIGGVDEAGRRPGVQVFAAGVAVAGAGPRVGLVGGAGPGAGLVGGAGRDGGAPLVTAGGRVLGVTALGADLPQARERAYDAVGAITWPGMTYRRDIAAEAARAGVSGAAGVRAVSTVTTKEVRPA
jgi:phosphoribosylamine--glycine ligase